MNEHDLLDAIGKTEETMLEASEKRHIPWKALLTAAACLVLVLSTAFSLISPFLHSKPLPGQIISTERITWLRNGNILANSPGNGSAELKSEYFSQYQFFFQMSVEARVLDVLPDRYQGVGSPSYSQKYRILRMELLDPIFASNMPSEFYYPLPEELSTDLKQFDSLIITIYQSSCENVMLQNVDRRRMEAFSFLFTPLMYTAQEGAVIACKDGKVDLSLWQLKGWRDQKKGLKLLTDRDFYSEYPGNGTPTVSEIKATIRQGVAEYQQKNLLLSRDAVVSNEDFNWPEAQAVLELVKPFENGYYSSHFGSVHTRQVYYWRYINGFKTNECIEIKLDDKAISYNNAFTEEDLKNLPDLTLQVLFARWRKAPATKGGKQLKFCGVNGSYEKHDDDVFGIVTIYWGYPDIEESPWYSCCVIRKVQKYSYLLVYPNGKTVQAKNRTELDQLIAEYTG